MASRRSIRLSFRNTFFHMISILVCVILLTTVNQQSVGGVSPALTPKFENDTEIDTDTPVNTVKANTLKAATAPTTDGQSSNDCSSLIAEGVIPVLGGTMVGDTTASADDFDDAAGNGLCAGTSYGPGGVPDNIHSFQVAQNGGWHFDAGCVTGGSSYGDTSMHIREDTGGGCPGDIIACNGDACASFASVIDTFLIAGTDYFLVMEGYSPFYFGAYTVDYIQAVAPCTTDADCSDGDPSNGIESCDANGQCQDGELDLCCAGDPSANSSCMGLGDFGINCGSLFCESYANDFVCSEAGGDDDCSMGIGATLGSPCGNSGTCQSPCTGAAGDPCSTTPYCAGVLGNPPCPLVCNEGGGNCIGLSVGSPCGTSGTCQIASLGSTCLVSGTCMQPTCTQPACDFCPGATGIQPPSTLAGEAGFSKDRYLSFNPNTNSNEPAAVRVTRNGGSVKYVDCTSIEDKGVEGWFASLIPGPLPASGNSTYFCDWSAVTPGLHVKGCSVVPGNMFDVDLSIDGTTFSSALAITTTLPQFGGGRQFGDVVGSLIGGAWTAPDGLVTANDIVAVVHKFQLASSAPLLSRVDNDGDVPNGIVAGNDILRAVIAFAGGDFGYGVTDCLTGTCLPDLLCEPNPCFGQPDGTSCPNDKDSCTNCFCTGGKATNQANSTCQNDSNADGKHKDVTGAEKKIADPVDIFTGAHVIIVTDLRIPGRGMDFVWTRTYDTNLVYGNGWELGTAWSSPYLQRLVDVDGFEIDYIAGTGRIDRHSFMDGITWGNAAHYYHKLIRDAVAQEFVMTSNGELNTVFHDFTVVGSPGRLKRIEDRFGNKLTFEYVVNLLVRVIDTFGRKVEIAYNSDGTISEITDFFGRSMTYSYYQAGDPDGNQRQIKSVEAPEVIGTSTGNDFSGTNRKTTVYTYTTGTADSFLDNQILTVTDPKGQTYLQNSYSSTTDPEDFLFNRVVEQIYGEGSFQFHYEELLPPEAIGTEMATMVVIVNDRRGLVTESRLNDKGNPVSERVYTGFADPNTTTTLAVNRPTGRLRAPGSSFVDPAFFESTTSYDSEGKALQRTNPRGDFRDYLYNTVATERHGENNVAEKDRNVGAVAGPVTNLVSSTTYENVYQLKKTATNPRGFTTTYFYDHEEATLGDMNGDGITTGTTGFLVRVAQNPVILGLAGASGSQDIVETYQYNQFAQRVRDVDGEGHVTIYEYYPENDPDGDGQDLILGRDAITGGYLRAVTVDPGGLNIRTSYSYDQVGNVVSITDPRNHTTTYEINQLNQVVRTSSPPMVLFPDDNSAVYENVFIYDANDNIEQSWVEHENSLNNEIANAGGFSQPNYFETRYTFDILDNQKSITFEVGNGPSFADQSLTTEYFYDASENLIRVRHPNGDEDAISYDERDLVFRTTIGDADVLVAKSITQLNYDANRNTVQQINPNPNNIINSTFDGFNRKLTDVIVGSSTTISYSYDNNSNGVGVRTNGLWDEGQPIVVLSHVETLFDELDRPYEFHEHLFRQEDGVGLQSGALTLAITKNDYDKDSLNVRTINPNNHTYFSTYDNADRLSTSTDAVGNLIQYIYGDQINVTQVITTEVNPITSPDVFNLMYEFDELNRLRRTEDDLVNITQFRLDSRGNVAIRTDAEGNQQKNKIDGLGRPYSDERQFSPTEFIMLNSAWDARSRVVLAEDGLGRDTNMAYDSHNRRTIHTNADATERHYTFDTEDNLTEILRENNERIENEFDDVNRLIERRYHDPGEVTPAITDRFQYNGLDVMTALVEVGGHGTTYKRESRNQTLECSQSIVGNPTRTFTVDYNAVANPTDLKYPGGRALSLGGYTDIELLGQISTPAAVIDYDYSGYGRIRNRTYNNGLTLEIGYDTIKRIVGYDHKSISGTPVGFTNQYDRVHNRIVEEFLNTINAENHARVFELDNYYRTTGFVRSLDPVKIPQAISDFSSITPAEGYDHETIILDEANNLDEITLDGIQHTLTDNVMNEMETFGTLRTNFLYDDNGRMLSYIEGADTYTFNWNLRDQLTAVRKNGGLVSAYEYYPDGMRAKKTVGPVEQHYYGIRMSVNQVYNFTPGPGEELEKEFIFQNLDRPLVMFADADNDLLTGDDGREPYFYHSNPKGDVYALSDAAGDIVERYDYSLYGDPVVITPASGPDIVSAFYNGTLEGTLDSNTAEEIVFNAANTWQLNELVGNYIGIQISGGAEQFFVITANLSFDNSDSTFTNTYTVAEDLAALGVTQFDVFSFYPPLAGMPVSETQFGNPFLFGGAFYDIETSMYQMRHRYYDPIMRRFISRDPAEDDSLGNLYAAFENNSGTFVDPLGLTSKQTDVGKKKDDDGTITVYGDKCCCAEDIVASHSKCKLLTSKYDKRKDGPKTRKGWGHEFTVIFQTSEKDAPKGATDTACKMEWWERQTAQPHDTAQHYGMAKNTWTELYAGYLSYQYRKKKKDSSQPLATHPQFDKWHNPNNIDIKKADAGKPTKDEGKPDPKNPVRIVDPPAYFAQPGKTSSRKLSFVIKLISGTECECTHPEVVVYATQILDVTESKGQKLTQNTTPFFDETKIFSETEGWYGFGHKEGQTRGANKKLPFTPHPKKSNKSKR